MILTTVGPATMIFGLTQNKTYRLLFMENPEFAHGTYSEGIPEGAPNPGMQALELLLGLVSDLQTAGLVDKSANPIQVMETYWTALHGIVSLHVTCSLFLQTDPRDLADGLVETLLQGLPR